MTGRLVTVTDSPPADRKTAGRPRVRVLLALALLVVTVAPSSPVAGTAPSEREKAESAFETYTAELESFHGRLLSALAEEAPDLHEELSREKPARTPFGYQLVPAVVANSRPPSTGLQSRSRSYSWSKLSAFIARERGQIKRREERLTEAPTVDAADRRAAFEALVTGYRSARRTHRTLERRLEHNNLWQPILARAPARYVARRELHDAVVERERLRTAGALGARDVEGGERRARLAAIDAMIAAASSIPYRRDYLELRRPEPGRWVFALKMYTDLEDEALVAAFGRAVESEWRRETPDGLFEVEIEWIEISAADLYSAQSDEVEPPPVPRRGETIDIRRHAGRFPDDGGCLTTGARSIRVIGAGCVVLSPLDLAPRTMAHEFGHVLGFRDEYVRAARDLGEAGYEILEIVPRMTDIMGSPGYGSVQPYHFEALLELYEEGPPAAVR